MWYKLRLNILISAQLCCAVSSWCSQIIPYKVFTATQKISHWTCVCLHKATSEVAWLLRCSDARSLVHTYRSGWTWLICRNVLLQGTEKGLRRYECAVACSTAHQCTCHSSSTGKLGRFGSLRRTGEQAFVTFACVYTSFLSVEETVQYNNCWGHCTWKIPYVRKMWCLKACVIFTRDFFFCKAVRI